jgi:hypothetical protein
MARSCHSLSGLVVFMICGGIVLSLLSSGRAFSQLNHEGHPTEQTATFTTPTMAGQYAFATIQEIVEILEADPTTDWSRVNLIALREHLVDMNEVTLNAAIEQREVNTGLEMVVTGTDRTKVGIQQLVPAHAQELNRLNGWQAIAASLPNGVRLTVTSNDPQQVDRIRALGFMGLLVSGRHHQAHHLALAKGIDSHSH